MGHLLLVTANGDVIGEASGPLGAVVRFTVTASRAVIPDRIVDDVSGRVVYRYTRPHVVNPGDTVITTPEVVESTGPATRIYEWSDPGPTLPPVLLLPAEQLALSVARAKLRRGENPGPNVTATLVEAIDRLTAATASVQIADSG